LQSNAIVQILRDQRHIDEQTAEGALLEITNVHTSV